MLSYSCYQLNILSDLDLPELQDKNILSSDCNDTDICIQRGKVPPNGLNSTVVSRPHLQINSQHIWMDIPDIVRFLVSKGREIIYQPLSDDYSTIRLFMMGACMAGILIQRNNLVLHANAFCINGEAILCVGDSGAGKSTLAAAIMKRGYEVIADDICAITNDGNILWGTPSIKLWKDSADKLEIDTSLLPRVHPAIDKYYYHLASSCKSSLPVKAIYVLDFISEGNVTMQSLNGADKFKLLLHHTYRSLFLAGMKKEAAHLQQCCDLSSQVHMSQLSRPKTTNSIDECVECLLRDIQQ